MIEVMQAGKYVNHFYLAPVKSPPPTYKHSILTLVLNQAESTE